MVETLVSRYGEYWAITRDDEHRLVHIPTGMELAPANYKLPWTTAHKRRAAKLLAAQGDVWNFDRTVASDGLHPTTINALERWREVEAVVCRKGRPA